MASVEVSPTKTLRTRVRGIRHWLDDATSLQIARIVYTVCLVLGALFTTALKDVAARKFAAFGVVYALIMLMLDIYQDRLKFYTRRGLLRLAQGNTSITLFAFAFVVGLGWTERWAARVGGALVLLLLATLGVRAYFGSCDAQRRRNETAYLHQKIHSMEGRLRAMEGIDPSGVPFIDPDSPKVDLEGVR